MNLIKDLTEEELAVIAEHRPERMADNRPELSEVPDDILNLIK